MKFFDFFKRKEKEPPKIQNDMPFSQIISYLGEKEKEIQNKEKQIFDLISEKILNFERTAADRINLVKEFDLDSKKAEEKLKILTDLGRKKYIESLENFIEKIKTIEKKELKKFFEKADRIFLDFNKNSHKDYEKATILIGKEMGDIREHLKYFSRDLVDILKKNKKVLELHQKISFIKEKLGKIEENQKNCEKIKEEIRILKEKVNEKAKKREEIIQNIEEIKKSENYLKNLKAKEEIDFFENELEEKISDLKKFIDFKALANFFHIFEDSMKILKEHRENFRTAFKKDYGDRILKLLNESKLSNPSTEEKIKEIKDKRQKIINCRKNLKENGIELLLPEAEKLNSDICELNKEIIKKSSVSEKIKTNNEELEKEIRKDAEDWHF